MKISNNIFQKSYFSWLILFLIIILAFVVRLYRIDTPIADWHSWRQADTAAVARNFYEEGYNPLYPRGDDISVISDTGEFNTQRYRFVEFPIYNSLVYFGYELNGGVDERIARFVSVLFSLGSLVFVYLLTRKYFGKLVGLTAAFLFAVLPFNIFYSRVILPEPSLVFWSLGTLYLADKWIREGGKFLFITSSFFGICALLTKPMAVFYFLPLIYSYYQTEGSILRLRWRYILWGVVVALPFIAWRIWISLYPEGIPASAWLLNGNGIRLRPAFFRWILGDRFGREILGITGTVLFFLGLFIQPKFKKDWLLHLLALSSFLYLVVFATGNVQHDYYQVLIVPVLVIFCAKGLVDFVTRSKVFLPNIIALPIGLFLITLMLGLTWIEVQGLYQVNNGAIITAGKRADEILPKDAKVVAPYAGDTAFLYHTNRSGISQMSFPPDRLHKEFGIDYYVSVNYDEDVANALKRYYSIEQTKDYIIIDLTREREDFTQ